MPTFFARIYHWAGTESEGGLFTSFADAHAWARQQCGKRDRAEIGFSRSEGTLYQKVCGNLVPVPAEAEAS